KESTRALWRPVTCGPPQDRGATQTSLRHLLTPALSLPETVRLPVEDEDVRPVRDAVQQRRGQSGVPEHLLPAGKLQVAGDDEAVCLVPLCHELEEQRCPRSQSQVAQLIADDQVKLGPTLQVAIGLDCLVGGQQLLGQRN